MEIRKWKELEAVLRKFQIEQNDICIVGSSIFALYDIRENNDIDLALRPGMREKILEKFLGEVELLPSGTINFNESVQAIKDRYGKMGVMDTELFEDKYTVLQNGCRMARLELELANKAVRGRDKDRADLQRVGTSYLNIEGFDVKLFESLKERGRRYNSKKGNI